MILPFLLLFPIGATYAEGPGFGPDLITNTGGGSITFRTEVDEDSDNDGNLDINEKSASLDGDNKLDSGADKDYNGFWTEGDIDYNNSLGKCSKPNKINCDPYTVTLADITSAVPAFLGEDSSGELELLKNSDDEIIGFRVVNGLLGYGQEPSIGEDLNGNNQQEFNEDIDGDGFFDITNEDANGNGVLDTGEDRDNDGVWSVADIDINNDLELGFNYKVQATDTAILGTTTGLDTHEDVNQNGYYDYLEDVDSDGIADSNEDFDLDGHFDQGEDTNGNKAWDVGEKDVNGSACTIYGLQCDSEGNPVSNYKVQANDGLDGTAFGMEFTEDLNLNGVFDAGEDLDNDGRFDRSNEDQNNDGDWDLVEDGGFNQAGSDGFWSAGDRDINNDLGLGYNYEVTAADVGDGGAITLLLKQAVTDNKVDDFLDGDKDSNGGWSVGDIDYGQQLAAGIRDPNADVWDPLTAAEVAKITSENTDQIAVLSVYYIAGLDKHEDTNELFGLSLFNEDLNGDGEVYAVSEDLDGDTHFDTGEDRDHNGEWSVGDIDYNGNLGRGRDYEITSADIVVNVPGPDFLDPKFLDSDESAAGNDDNVFSQFNEDIDGDKFFEIETDDLNQDGNLDLVDEDVDLDGFLDLTAETTMTVVDQDDVGSTLNVIAPDLQLNGDSVALDKDLVAVLGEAALNRQGISTLVPVVATNESDIFDLEVDRQNMIGAIGLTVAPQIDNTIVAEVLSPSWNPDGTIYLDGTNTVMQSVVALDFQLNEFGSDLADEAVTARDAEQANATAIAAEAVTARAAEQANETAIAAEAVTARAAEQANDAAITAEAVTARAAEQANDAAITAEAVTARAAEQANDAAITAEAVTARANETAISTALTAESNRAMDAEMANLSLINTNASDIAANQGHLRQLDADVDMLRSGVAMSMAMAGMPTTGSDGTSFALGLGNFDGESAVAMGFTHKTKRAAFKFALTHSGGETGVSAGAAWKIGD